MKFAGLLVMPAGFFLSIAALVLFLPRMRWRAVHSCYAAWPLKHWAWWLLCAGTWKRKERVANDDERSGSHE